MGEIAETIGRRRKWKRMAEGEKRRLEDVCEEERKGKRMLPSLKRITHAIRDWQPMRQPTVTIWNKFPFIKDINNNIVSVFHHITEVEKTSNNTNGTLSHKTLNAQGGVNCRKSTAFVRGIHHSWWDNRPNHQNRWYPHPSAWTVSSTSGSSVQAVLTVP